MTRNKMKPFGFGLLTGLLAYALVGKLSLYLLQLSWAEYAERSSDKSYTLPMLLARLMVGLLAAVVASGVATKIANDTGKSAWLVGVLVFIGGAYIHLLTAVWMHYPVWYHWAYLLPILPVIGLSHSVLRKYQRPSQSVR